MRKAIKDQAAKLAAAIRETGTREIEYRIGSFGLELADGSCPPANMLQRIQQLSIQSETVCQWAEANGERRDCKIVRSARDGAYYLGEYRWLDNNGLRYDVVYYQIPNHLEPQIRSLQKQAMAHGLGDEHGCSPCAPVASFAEASFPIGHRHLNSAGAYACRHTCCPRRFFGFSPLPEPLGWGVAAVPPQPAF